MHALLMLCDAILIYLQFNNVGRLSDKSMHNVLYTSGFAKSIYYLLIALEKHLEKTQCIR